MVGGLPPSASSHPAFWSGARAGWPGFRTVDVRLGQAVTFVRQAGSSTAGLQEPAPVGGTSASTAQAWIDQREGPPDLVLVGCVKSKLGAPARAADLYTSTLFKKERAYAEASGVPWFVLSSEHGLVDPAAVIAPYDTYLAGMPAAYRSEWGRGVVTALAERFDLAGLRVEIHAGDAYARSIREGLRSSGAVVVEPLAGMRRGERLAWYPPLEPVGPGAPTPDRVADVVDRLTRHEQALTPDELVAGGKVGLEVPGLYSWWVDAPGAQDLAVGLGEPLAAGLIYAGLAGATRSLSGRRSTNTLWGRLAGMHLGGRHEFSTFRRSLGSVLAAALGEQGIDEELLTSWMRAHLRVIPLVVHDANALDGLETAVLADLDPPLNLAKMPKTAVRHRLSQLRKTHSTGRSSPPPSAARHLVIALGADQLARVERAAEVIGLAPVDLIVQAAVDRADEILGP